MHRLDLMELLSITRIVPVVIFLRPGPHPLRIDMGSEREALINR